MIYDVDLEEVLKILQEGEKYMKQGNNGDLFDEVNTLSKLRIALKDYGNTRYVFTAKENDKISMDPIHVFIRALSSGEGVENIPQFQELVSELADRNSQLADYLISCNPAVNEETRIKLAKKENVSDAVLVNLADNSQNITLLESLIDSENDYVKLFVLNNPVFSESEKAIEYFNSCIENFPISYLESLACVPEACMEDYEYFRTLRRIESNMQLASSRVELFSALDEVVPLEEAVQEYHQLQEQYEDLKSKRMKK